MQNLKTADDKLDKQKQELFLMKNENEALRNDKTELTDKLNQLTIDHDKLKEDYF